MEETMNPQTKELTPISATTSKVAAFVAKMLAEREAHYKQFAGVLANRYDLDMTKDSTLIWRLYYALKAAEDCRSCDGTICKHTQYDKDIQPTIVESRPPYVADALCKHKLAVHEQAAFRRANLPRKYVHKKFADYEVTAVNKKAVGLAKWFVDTKTGKGLYYYGGVGTGKTFLTVLIAQEYIRQRILLYDKPIYEFFDKPTEVVYEDVPTMLEGLKRTYNLNEDETYGFMNRHCYCPILIMDDLGAGQITEWSVGILYEILNARYDAGKRTIITSNFDFKGLKERLATRDAYSAERIVSRIKEMTYAGFLGTDDRRN